MSQPTPKATRELQKSLSKLNLANLQTPPATPSSNSKPKSSKSSDLPDSWSDDETSPPASPSLQNEPPTALRPGNKPLDDGFSAPPSTPLSPSTSTSGKFSSYPPEELFSPTGELLPTNTADKRRGDGVRGEKTDAVAKRLIAGALGIRAPKKTEEQKGYEKAVREREVKRREEERESVKRQEEERNKGRAAVWDD